MDPTLGQTHFTLPDVNNSVDYDDEEAEMDELIDKLDKVYPVDMSHSSKLHDFIGTLGHRNQPVLTLT